MGLLGSLVMRYAAEGHQGLVRADKQVRDSVSKTARHAQRDEGKTKMWLQRHMTALLAVAGVIGAAMYTIARESPSMSAAIGEIRLAFSLFFMDVGERAAPFFERLAKLTWALLNEWDKLPEGLKDALFMSAPEIAAVWDTLLLDLAATLDRYFGTGDWFQTIAGSVIKYIKNIMGGVLTLGRTIGEAWEGTLATITEHWEAFKEDPIGWGKDLVNNFIKGIGNKVTTLYNNVAGVLGTVAGKFDDWLPGARQWGTNLVNNFITGIGNKVTALYNNVAGVLGKVAGKFRNWLPGARQWGTNLVNNFITGIRNKVTTLYNYVVGVLGTVAGKFRNGVSGAWGWGADLMNNFIAGIGNKVTALYNYVAGILGTVAGKFRNGVSGAWGWGADLMNNFISGIWSGAGELWSTLETIWSMIEDVISFDVTANDRMAYRWGADMVQQFEAGMRSMQFAPVLPVAAPAPTALSSAGGSRGGDTYITIESGAVQVMGAAAQTFDERSIGRIVRDEIGQALRERTR